MPISKELRQAIKEGMHAAYAEVRFVVPRRPARWPQCFATITGYATTGKTWSDAKNKKADEKLKAFLKKLGVKAFRITGYSAKDIEHAEPGWGVALSFDDACDIGLLFKQDAIFYIINNTLFVSYCDQRRGLIKVGAFAPRVVSKQDRER